MKPLVRLLFPLLALLSFTVSAADDQAAAQLRKLLDAMDSLQGKFVQTTYDKKGAEQEQSSGNFMLMRPGKFYWETLEPMPQLLVSNNKTIWLYDADLETVTERAFSDDLRQTPALLLSADIEQLRKSFTITQTSKDKSTTTFTMTPKVTEGLFQQLSLVFSTGQLSEFVIQDSLGQTTRAVLQDAKRNQPLPEEKFYFIPPQGVEVIKD
jgi:outer membrane lipoprotein carrier protein